MRLTWLVARLRPDVVISTGAAPGYFASASAHARRAHAVSRQHRQCGGTSLSANLARRTATWC